LLLGIRRAKAEDARLLNERRIQYAGALVGACPGQK